MKVVVRRRRRKEGMNESTLGQEELLMMRIN